MSKLRKYTIPISKKNDQLAFSRFINHFSYIGLIVLENEMEWSFKQNR